MSAEEPFSRTGNHDPAQLNELAGLIIDGFDSFVNLTDRYGTAVLILESDWLKEVRAKAWDEGAKWAGAIELDGVVSTENPHRKQKSWLRAEYERATRRQ